MDVSNIMAFENVKGGFRNDCKDVYFIRLQGANASLVNDINNMDADLTEQMLKKKSAYVRITELPRLADKEQADYYAAAYGKWIESGKKSMEIKAAAGQELLSVVLADACKQVMEIFRNGGNVNETVEKNFAVKLLFWFDYIMESFGQDWDVRLSMKAVVDNVAKKQEYLFYYFLTLTGIDVLLIQNEKDIEKDIEKLGFSKTYLLGGYAECEIPKYDKHKYTVKASPQPVQAVSPPQQSVQAASNRPVRVVIPKHPHAQQRSAQPPHAAGMLQRSSTPLSGVPQPSNAAPAGVPQPSGAVSSGSARIEKSFEELALLASSVVFIGIHNEKGEIIGSGSGIMIGRGGYILTNNHVASGGVFYSVRIEEDDNEYKTDEVIKYNPMLDLAVIRIDRELNPLSVYKGSQKLVRGQRVVAIGSPLGLFNSVSDGIISGFRKFENNVDMIQFTAPTSHGSSGGAVLNMYGEVIGISTAGIDAGQNINLAMGYECINMFIQGFTG